MLNALHFWRTWIFHGSPCQSPLHQFTTKCFIWWAKGRSKSPNYKSRFFHLYRRHPRLRCWTIDVDYLVLLYCTIYITLFLGKSFHISADFRLKKFTDTVTSSRRTDTNNPLTLSRSTQLLGQFQLIVESYVGHQLEMSVLA